MRKGGRTLREHFTHTFSRSFLGRLLFNNVDIKNSDANKTSNTQLHCLVGNYSLLKAQVTGGIRAPASTILNTYNEF